MSVLLGFPHYVGFPGGSVINNLSAMQETRVRSQGREDPLAKGMATHSSNLPGESPWTEEPGVRPWGRKTTKCLTHTISSLTLPTWELEARKLNHPHSCHL